MRARLSALLLGGLLALGCIPEDAGYRDVRRLVADRTGHDVRRQRSEGESLGREARDLLREPLTSERAVALALLHNPELQLALEDLGIARADAVSRVALPNPTAEVGVKLGGGRARWEVAVTQDLLGFLLLPSKHGLARAELDAAALAAGGRVLDVALDVRRAFYRLQAAEQAAALDRTGLKAARASADASQALHDAGNVTDLDLESQRALYADARLAAAAAEAELASQRETFRALLGLWGRDGDYRVAPTLPEPDDTPLDTLSLERKAIERSLDLALARRQYEAAARRSNLARVQGVLPELKAGASAEREAGEWHVGPLVELEVPLFYQGQGEIGRARAEMQREQRRHRALAIQIRAAVRSTATRALAARQLARHYAESVLPLRRRIAEETELQYNAMNASVFELLQSKREQVQAERARVGAVRDYWIARAELDQLVAGRLARGTVPASSEGLAGPTRAPTPGH